MSATLLISRDGNFILPVAHTKKPGWLLGFSNSLPVPTSSNKQQLYVHSIFRIGPLLSTLLPYLLPYLELSWHPGQIMSLFSSKFLFVPSLSEKAQGLWALQDPYINLSGLPCSWSVTCPKAFVHACSVWNALLPTLRPSLPGTYKEVSLTPP